jgi:hypothetical protein
MRAFAVSTAGELTAAPIVVAKLADHPDRLIRVLTHVGDVLVSASVPLAGAQGPVAADEVQPGPRSIEFAAPSGLPRATGRTTPLAGLGSIVTAIPEEVADVQALKAALRRAGTDHTVSVRGGWAGVRIAATRKGRQWSWADELELLLLLTSWTTDNGASTCRTRFADRPLRARLIGALAGCGQDFDLRWLPAYLPVEARLVLVEAAPAAFAGVVGVEEVCGEFVEVVVRDAAALIVDLAYVRLRRTEV